MADNDSNIIKPVESLQNIAGLNPARRRERRKRRQEFHQQKRQESEQETNNAENKQITGSRVSENEEDRHNIDYCA